MPAPSYTRTWIQNNPTGLPGTRVLYTSLVGTMGGFVYGLKEFFKANGMTVVASCTGATTASSDLITSAAQFATRATTSALAQSWIILRDGNNGQLLFAYTGATDDVAYIAYSPGGLFGTGVLARPSATDEQALTNRTTPDTVIGTSTSGDRVWHAVISSDAKAYRFFLARQGAVVNRLYAVETFAPVAYAANVSVNPVCAWSSNVTTMTDLSTTFSTGAAATPRWVPITVASVGYNTDTQAFRPGFAMAGDLGGNSFITSGLVAPGLQGNLGFWPTSVFLVSTNANTFGIVGRMRDFWLGTTINGATAGTAGTMAISNFAGQPFDPAYAWFQVGYHLWPNPSQQPPMMT